MSKNINLIDESLIKKPFFNEDHKKFVNNALNLILNFYVNNLVTLTIFGSYARGTFRFNSDLDVFIILKDKKPRKQIFDDFFEHIERPFLNDELYLYNKYGIDISLSPFILSKNDADYFYPIYLDMLDFLIIIKDEKDFFKNILSNLHVIKNKYGFKKELSGNNYIWDITGKNMIGKKICG